MPTTDAAPISKLTPRWCFLLYFLLSGLCVVVHNRLVDAPAQAPRRELHHQILTNQAAAPNQYRVLAPLAAETLQTVGKALDRDWFRISYLLLRWAATFACGLLLHHFLSLYFPSTLALLGTTLFYAWQPVTYINYFMQEADPFNLVFFLAGFLLIRQKRDALLAGLIALAMTNRETAILLPLVWLLYRWDDMPPVQAGLRFAGLSAVGLGAYAALRLALGHHAGYAEANSLPLNLRNPNTYIYFALLFGAVLPPVIRHWRGQPKFLRRLILFLPFFLVFHFVLPIFEETRIFLPIMPILIAGALAAFARPADQAYAAEKESVQRAFPPTTVRALYAAALLAFSAATGGYLYYLNRVQTDAFHARGQADFYLNEGLGFAQQKAFLSAAQSWEKGLVYNPDSFPLHMNLAAVYLVHLSDPDRAGAHLKRCRAISPNAPEALQLQALYDRWDRT